MHWNEQKLAGLPVKDGFYLRGNEMTRIEIFVAAAFAFLMTMVMVAGNDIPQNMDDFRLALLNIPAFCICALQIIWIWYEHAIWSRRFGMEDAWTIVLSGLLTVIVLVYIYPLKAMASGFFHWMSDGFFPAGLSVSTMSDVRFLFVFYSGGFFALALTFLMMQKLALARHQLLNLTTLERYQTQTEIYAWLVMLITAALSICLALLLDHRAVSVAGLIYMSLGVSLTTLHILRGKHAPAANATETPL